MMDCSRNIYMIARKAAGFTREAAAAMLNVSVRCLADYESGIRMPPGDIVESMVDCYRAPYLALQHLRATNATARRIIPDTAGQALPEAVLQLIGKIYAPGFGKREVAALAPLVGAAAEQGDAAALQIVEKAGRELALLVRPVAEKLGLQSARIAFAGSVLQKCAPVRSAAQAQLQTLLPQLTLAEPQGDAAAGAVLLARCKAEE